MWVALALGSKLYQPLAAMLDRVFVDIAIHWTPETGNSSAGSFAHAFHDVDIAFERFSSSWSAAGVAQHFRHTPVCFAPVYRSPSTLHAARRRAAAFADRIGTLLEERLGVRGEAAYGGIAPDQSDDSGFAARLDELTAQTEELLRSDDWANLVLGHRMLLRAQALCELVTSGG
jgi:hypothetical protein